MLTEGTKAPQFSATDQTGKTHSLDDYTGKWLLLYFYPKDDTPGCTKEACMIRDVWTEFEEAGIAVLGVSADSVESHKKFAEKYTLPFPLLADEDKEVMKVYHAWGEKKVFGVTKEGILRISYLISPDGTIAKAYPKVQPAQHATQILSDVKELQ